MNNRPVHPDRWWLWIVLLSCAPGALAQPDHFRWHSIEDGLPQSQVFSIVQDRRGYLWFGTGDGLSRFDGLRFHNYDPEDGLPGRAITALLEDHEGRLWVGTPHGLASFDGKTFTRYSTHDGLADNGITTLLEDHEGRLWVGTLHGISQYRDGRFMDTAFTGNVSALVEDADGHLWIGTPGEGVVRYDGSRLTSFTRADGLPHDFVSDLIIDEAGDLWIGTGAGLSRYDGHTFHTLTTDDGLAGDVITALRQDHEGTLWIGSRSGLSRVHDGTVTHFRHEHDLNVVYSIYEDDENNLWIGTATNGVGRYAPTAFSYFGAQENFPSSPVLSMLEDSGGTIWFGTSRGVSRLDETGFHRVIGPDGLPGNTVRAIAEDHEGNLWFGTVGQGLTRYDGTHFTHFTTRQGLAHDLVEALLVDRDGTLWVGTHGGVSRFDGTGFTNFTAKDGLTGSTVYTIYRDRMGVLWFGTEAGVVSFDGRRFVPASEEKSVVLSIREDEDGRMWLATYGNGVRLYHRDKAHLDALLDTFTPKDGLPNAVVYLLHFDRKGHLWIGTNKGLSRLNLPVYRKTGHKAFRQYGPADGLVGMETNRNAVLATRGGDLWFGTIKGAVRYDPGADLHQATPPRTYLTNIRLFFEDLDAAFFENGVDSALPAQLRLDHTQNHLTFDFVGLDYRAPEQVRYQYKLDGFDQEWSPIGEQRYATYANLPPGIYTFMVRARNHYGGGFTNPTTYRFTITPPFWQRWWFAFLVLSALIGLFIGSYRFRGRQIRARNAALEAQVTERTAVLEQTNARLEDEVNERRRAERVIRENEEKYELLFQQSSDALFLHDLEGNLLDVNQHTCDLLGASRDELLTMLVHDFVPPDSRAQVQQNFQTAIREGWVRGELDMRRKDGTRFPAELSASIFEIGGRHVVQAILRDITERREYEQELMQARDRAEEMARLKSSFLANMSHEIRTPMNGVIGMTDLLQTTPLSPEQREYVEIIHTSGETLLAIINDILDFSKIEAGKVELEAQPFEVRMAVERAFDLVATRASEKGLEMAYLLEPEVPQAVNGDVTRLRQVLINLLSNAIKFTPEGEVVVTVGAEALPENRYRLHFAVRDTGIGIPADRRHRLFEAFSQVDSSTTRRFGGTGLGLAISKRLCTLMGGDIWVESEEGHGATFHFTIVAEATPHLHRVTLRGPQLHLKGKRVLIVDDNETNRRILCLQMEEWGLLPQVAASPAEGLALIRSDAPFDVALLDMQMPDMDGLTLAHEIRCHRSPAALPLIMLSSIDKPVEADGRILFASLTKPTKQLQLYQTILEAVAARVRLQQKPAAPLPPAPPSRPTVRILLAEDNPVNQKVTLRLLERLGYRADVADNGLAVLAALDDRPYDVILMDVQMPELDGLETAHRITETCPPGRRPYMIALTANALAGDEARCLAAGMHAYLSKPVKREALEEALRVYAATRPPRRAEVTPGSRRGVPGMPGRLRDASGPAPGWRRAVR